MKWRVKYPWTLREFDPLNGKRGVCLVGTCFAVLVGVYLAWYGNWTNTMKTIIARHSKINDFTKGITGSPNIVYCNNDSMPSSTEHIHNLRTCPISQTQVRRETINYCISDLGFTLHSEIDRVTCCQTLLSTKEAKTLLSYPVVSLKTPLTTRLIRTRKTPVICFFYYWCWWTNGCCEIFIFDDTIMKVCARNQTNKIHVYALFFRLEIDNLQAVGVGISQQLKVPHKLLVLKSLLFFFYIRDFSGKCYGSPSSRRPFV